MPLLDIVNGDYGKIFEDWIKVFDIGPSKARLEIDGALFSLDCPLIVELDYSEDRINSLSIIDFKIDTLTVNLTVNLHEYDEKLAENRLSVVEPRVYFTYINFNYMDLFLQIGINTTQSRRFHLFGDFNLSLPKTLESIISDIANN